VLYNLAIFHPKKIHHRIAEFTGATHPVTVKDDHVSIRERSFDLHVRFGVVAAKPGDKLGYAIPVVLDYGSMLCIAVV
jgi:hypothetical protein